MRQPGEYRQFSNHNEKGDLNSVTVNVDRKVLIEALNSTKYTRSVFSTDYKRGNENLRDTIEIDSHGVGGGNLSLTITVGQSIEKPAITTAGE